VGGHRRFALVLTVLAASAVIAGAGCDGTGGGSTRTTNQRQTPRDHASDEHGHAPIVPGEER
jgi:hypothetical protein